MLNTAEKMFIQYEKEQYESNQLIKSYENYIGDNEIKMLFETNFLKITKNDTSSEKDEINKK